MASEIKNAGVYILERCERWAERVFLKEKKTGTQLTYSELRKQILAATEVFRDHGIEPGDRILIEMDNQIGAVVHFFSSLVAGVIPVIISTRQKIDEVAAVIERCQARALCLAPLAEDKYANAMPIPLISHGIRDADTIPVNLEPSPVKGEQTAYIVFTTGTTGTAKKVEISHANMLSEIESMAAAYGLTGDDRHLCVLPVYHASGLYRNIMLSFDAGAFTVLCEHFEKELFWKDIEAEDITFVQVVPSILKTLLIHDEFFEDGQQKSLKAVGSASAPHPKELVESFESRFAISVLQGYGMTEATCGITLNPLPGYLRKPGSVGMPLSVNRIEVWDDNGERLPVGKSGRIIVFGKNIADCEDSGISAGVADNHPDGFLETGDIGYIDDDGFLWLIARQQDIIKRGGYRLSPEEIESAVLSEFPDLEVAVVGVSHPLLGQDVVAFVTSPEREVTGRAIIKKIKKHIAAYKIPSKFYFVDKIPMVGVGKIDKKGLAELYNNNKKG